MSDLPSGPQLIASATRFLIEGGDNEAATVLLSCSVDRAWVKEPEFYDPNPTSVFVSFVGPRSAYDLISDTQSDEYSKIWRAVAALIPRPLFLQDIYIRAGVVALEPDWHAEMLALASGRDVTNQASDTGADKLWNRLRFRSATEVKIAEALDRKRVLFFPLCRARLNGPQGRVNREPDFLICQNGKWGILEVDGEPYHPPQRTVQDHERDRLFQQHGIRLIQHYDSTDCYVTPDKVVTQFLALLDQAY